MSCRCDEILGRLADIERAIDNLAVSRQPDELLDVAGAARCLGVSKDYIYRHAADLGAIRLGASNSGPLRFRPEDLLKRPDRPAPPRRRARRRPAKLIPIRGASQ